MSRVRMSFSARGRALGAGVLVVGALAAAAPAAHAGGAYVQTGTLTLPTDARFASPVLLVDPVTHDVRSVSSSGSLAEDRLVTWHDGAVASSVPIGTGVVGDSAYDPGERKAYLATYFPDEGFRGELRIVAGTTVTRVPMPTGFFALRVDVDPSTHTAYVIAPPKPDPCESPIGCEPDPARPKTRLLVIRGGAVTATITLADDASDLSVDPSNHAVAVAQEAADAVTVFQGATLTARIPVPDAYRLVYDTASHRLHVLGSIGRYAPTTLSIVDVAAKRVVQTSTNLGDPDDIAVDPLSHRTFVLGVYGGLTIAEANGDGVVQTLVDGGATTASAVAVDPSNGRVHAAVQGSEVRQYETSDTPLIQRSGPNQGERGGDGEPLLPTVYAVFSQAMDKASVAAAFTVTERADDGTTVGPVSGTITWFGDRVLTWRPSQKLRGLTYYAAAVTGTARDTEGRRLFAAAQWGFQTMPAPIPAQVVQLSTGFAPECVYPGTPFWAYYSVPVDMAKVSAATSLVDGIGKAYPGRTWVFGDQLVGYAPDTPLALGATGTFAIADTRNAEGDPVLGFTRPFTVVPAPSLGIVGPADGATGVSATAPPIYAVFAQAMDKFTVAYTFTLKRVSDGQPVVGSVAFFGEQIAGFKPQNPLAANARYTATITPLARDTRGCGLPGAVSWSFTTAAAGAASTGASFGLAAAPVDARLAKAAASAGK